MAFARIELLWLQIICIHFAVTDYLQSFPGSRVQCLTQSCGRATTVTDWWRRKDCNPERFRALGWQRQSRSSASALATECNDS